MRSRTVYTYVYNLNHHTLLLRSITVQLREFVTRFNPILNIGLRNLEELDDFASLHDPSAKAILLSLLELLAIEDEAQKKVGIRRRLFMAWNV